MSFSRKVKRKSKLESSRSEATCYVCDVIETLGPEDQLPDGRSKRSPMKLIDLHPREIVLPVIFEEPWIEQRTKQWDFLHSDMVHNLKTRTGVGVVFDCPHCALKQEPMPRRVGVFVSNPTDGRGLLEFHGRKPSYPSYRAALKDGSLIETLVKEGIEGETEEGWCPADERTVAWLSPHLWTRSGDSWETFSLTPNEEVAKDWVRRRSWDFPECRSWFGYVEKGVVITMEGGESS
jgi:hypothetical protein